MFICQVEGSVGRRKCDESSAQDDVGHCKRGLLSKGEDQVRDMKNAGSKENVKSRDPSEDRAPPLDGSDATAQMQCSDSVRLQTLGRRTYYFGDENTVRPVGNCWEVSKSLMNESTMWNGVNREHGGGGSGSVVVAKMKKPFKGLSLFSSSLKRLSVERRDYVNVDQETKHPKT